MKKRILSGILVAAMATTMFATTVFAAEGTGETLVVYNNANEIPAPGHEDDPDWAVVIPNKIEFTDEVNEIDTTVKLVPKYGHTLEGVANVDVKVSSAHSYQMQLQGGSDPVSYDLTYGENTNNGTVGVMSEDCLLYTSRCV